MSQKSGQGFSWIDELVKIAVMLAVVGLLRSSVVGFYVIPTGSMLPTIKLNDRLITNKLAYGLMLPFAETQIISWGKPQRGDIVLFEYPAENEADRVTFVKRVIGLEGDSLSFANGVLQINGQAVEEVVDTQRDFLSDMTSDPQDAADKALIKERLPNGVEHHILRMTEGGQTRFESRQWKVPAGKLMVIGDNRDGSNDSRAWGFVETKKIYGKAVRIFYSSVPHDGWFPRFRTDRFFQPLH